MRFGFALAIALSMLIFSSASFALSSAGLNLSNGSSSSVLSSASPVRDVLSPVVFRIDPEVSPSPASHRDQAHPVLESQDETPPSTDSPPVPVVIQGESVSQGSSSWMTSLEVQIVLNSSRCYDWEKREWMENWGLSSTQKENLVSSWKAHRAMVGA